MDISEALSYGQTFHSIFGNFSVAGLHIKILDAPSYPPPPPLSFIFMQFLQWMNPVRPSRVYNADLCRIQTDNPDAQTGLNRFISSLI